MEDKSNSLDPKTVNGASLLLTQLDKLVNLQGGGGDTTSDNFKRVLAYYLLSSIADFYQLHNVPPHIIKAIDDVGEGLFNLNYQLISPVFDVPGAQNRPRRTTELEKLRAQVAAYVYVMTLETNLSGKKKAPVARDIRAKLMPDLVLISDQADDTENPERFLTNLAGKYARNEIGDEIARFHFRHFRERYESAFARISPDRRGQLEKAISSDIKQRLKMARRPASEPST